MKTSKKIKRWMKNFFFNVCLIILLVVGLALIFNNQLRGWLVEYLGQKHAVAKLTPDIIENNKMKEANFNYEIVSPIDMNQILNTRFSNKDLPVICQVQNIV